MSIALCASRCVGLKELCVHVIRAYLCRASLSVMYIYIIDVRRPAHPDNVLLSQGDGGTGAVPPSTRQTSVYSIGQASFHHFLKFVVPSVKNEQQLSFVAVVLQMLTDTSCSLLMLAIKCHAIGVHDKHLYI